MGFKNLIICTGVLLGFSSLLHSQVIVSGVGINTTNPRTTLEVAGDTFVDGALNVQTINQVSDSDNVALLGQISGGLVKDLNTETGSVAIAYFQQYEMTNLNGDWILNFNTNIPSSKYLVTITSAVFDQELIMSNGTYFTIPYISAYIAPDNNWHIIADYPTAANIVAGKWIISTMILSRDFSKPLGTVVQNLGGNDFGAAATPIIN